MFTNATLVYVAKPGNASLAAIAAEMAVPPVPTDLLAAIGAELISDATVIGVGQVARTLVVGLAALIPATLAPVMTGDGQSVTSVTVTVPGAGYRGVPIVTAPGSALRNATLKAYLDVREANRIAGGVNYIGPTNVYFQGGLELPQSDVAGNLSAPSCVQSVAVISKGRGYSANAKVQFEAVLAPSGRLPTVQLTLDGAGRVASLLVTDSGQGIITVPKVFVWDPGPTGNGSGGGSGAELTVSQLGVGTVATATATVVANDVLGLVVTNNGGPYVRLPRILITDPTGAGANFNALMGIHEVRVFDGGVGYQAPPAVAAQDFFANTFTGANAVSGISPFCNLMKTSIETALQSPITSAPPTIL